MSDDQFKAFLEAVEADAALQEKVQAEANRYADAVVAIAKEVGFRITAEDVKRAQLEISEDDLDGVVGGAAPDLGEKQENDGKVFFTCCGHDPCLGPEAGCNSETTAD